MATRWNDGKLSRIEKNFKAIQTHLENRKNERHGLIICKNITISESVESSFCHGKRFHNWTTFVANLLNKVKSKNERKESIIERKISKSEKVRTRWKAVRICRNEKTFQAN